MHRYFAVHKPYGMLSQFTGGHKGLQMLGGLGFPFPEGTHAVGRLDYTSEGLLILTTNPAITKLLFSSAVPHQRSYLVNVYKEVSDDTIHLLATGASIRIKGGVDYTTARPSSNVRQGPLYSHVTRTSCGQTSRRTGSRLPLPRASTGRYARCSRASGIPATGLSA